MTILIVMILRLILPKDSKYSIVRIKGAIFCQVNMSVRLNHVKPSMICGTHKWNGAAPSLINNLIKIKVEKKSREDRKLKIILPLKALQIKIADAKAWIRKYFSVASEFREDLNLIKRANSPNMLISSPIHAIIQEEAEVAINVPRRITYKNIIFHGRSSIKKGNSLHIWDMSPKAWLAYSFVFWCYCTGNFDFPGINSS